MAHVAFRSDLPEPLLVRAELAPDLRWTWSHAGGFAQTEMPQ